MRKNKESENTLNPRPILFHPERHTNIQCIPPAFQRFLLWSWAVSFHPYAGGNLAEGMCLQYLLFMHLSPLGCSSLEILAVLIPKTLTSDSLTQWDRWALCGFLILTQQPVTCLQAVSWGNYKAHPTCFPSHENHSPLSVSQKSLFRIYLSGL